MAKRQKKMKRYIATLRQWFRVKDFKNQEVSASIRPYVKSGIIAIIVIIGFFGIWGSFAPIDSAAIAPGSVILESNRKTIQHLEGGVIEDILVKDGDLVTEGQPLVRLNETAAKARLEVLMSQWRVAKTAESRLIAERNEHESITFPPQVLAYKDDPMIAKVIDSQAQLFKTKVQSMRGQIDVLEQQILQYEQQIEGLTAQKNSVSKQSKLIEEEVVMVEELFKEGYAEKPRLLALKRSSAELEGSQGEYLSELAKTHEGITETQMQIFNIKNEYMKEVAAEQKEVQQEVKELEEEISAAKDVLNRLVILAPKSGKITGLQFHTIGGVISPGAALMDIVPQNDKLIVEAQVSPQDIDIVHEGLSAKVMLSAYSSRFVPRVSGEVVYVSADRFINEQTGEPYYLAKIVISDDALEKIKERVTLYPGMPAEVFIVTGSRTFLAYMFSPILDSFRRAFKEG